MKIPTISIIVPIYKVESYLRKCIESVLSQSFSDFELLLVDDGSPDGCPAICDEYASTDTRVKALHKQNGGLSSARNYGMDRAKGKWIIFLDSDDLWGDSDGLRKLVEYAEKLDLDILRFEYQAIDEKGHKIYPRPYVDKGLPDAILSNFQMVDKAIAGEWFAVLFLINQKVTENIRFNESCCFQEDIDFYCRLFAMKEYRCGYIAEHIYNYRKREASITTTFNVNNLIGSFNLCDVFYDQSETTTNKDLRDLYKYDSVMMYYWTLCTLSEKPYYSHRKEIICQLQVDELQSRTCRRMREVKIPLKYRFFILNKPMIGTYWLHLKNSIVMFINRIK